jgi:hypothetical protein
MATTNDITGDVIASRANTQAFEDGYDRIFRKPVEKPVVHYDRSPSNYWIQVGHSAYVTPLDHQNHLHGQHVVNGLQTRTSIVQSYDEETGVFETLNTRYVPFKHPEPAL